MENAMRFPSLLVKRLQNMSDELNEEALRYHRASPVGKLEIVATKPLANQHDLALAYSPGVAAACQEIVRDPSEVATVTARGNLVAVVTNGTAVLGLGAIGPLASKPVMEGLACLLVSPSQDQRRYTVKIDVGIYDLLNKSIGTNEVFLELFLSQVSL